MQNNRINFRINFQSQTRLLIGLGLFLSASGCKTGLPIYENRSPASDLKLTTQKQGSFVRERVSLESAIALELLTFSTEDGSWSEAEISKYQCYISKVKNGDSLKFVVQVQLRSPVSSADTLKKPPFYQEIFLPLAKEELQENMSFPPVVSRSQTIRTNYSNRLLENRITQAKLINGDIDESLLQLQLSPSQALGSFFFYEKKLGPAKQTFDNRAITQRVICGIRLS